VKGPEKGGGRINSVYPALIMKKFVACFSSCTRPIIKKKNVKKTMVR